MYIFHSLYNTTSLLCKRITDKCIEQLVNSNNIKDVNFMIYRKNEREKKTLYETSYAYKLNFLR